MIQISNLSFSYTPQSTLRFPGVEVKRGGNILLLGESGSGKTTLLHLMGGLLRNYSGSIKVDETELSALSESSLDKFRGQKIGFIFQRNHLISALSVEENIMMSPYLAGLNMDHQRIDHVLSSLGLSEKRKSKVTQLSQGQAQRVAI